MSVKCVWLTDKSAKNGSLSVNLSEILAHRPEQEKIRTNHGTDFHHYLVTLASTPCHNQVSPHNPLVPSTLARARRAYPSQAQLGYAGAERSLPHLVLIGLRPATRLMISSCRSADHSRPSLSPALLSGWSSHLNLPQYVP